VGGDADPLRVPGWRSRSNEHARGCRRAPSGRHHQERIRWPDRGEGFEAGRCRPHLEDTTHLFQPLLYQVATGILSEGEIAPTTRLILRKQKNIRVFARRGRGR
jgi:hypothetical protein